MPIELFEQLAQPFTGEELFDHLPDIVYFIKNARGEYLVVNRTLVQRCGARDKAQLIGRLPSQVLQPPLGQRFEEQDRQVVRTGQPLISQLELHVYPSGEQGWCLTTKLPLRGRGGRVVGVVGVSQDLRLPDLEAGEYPQVAAAVDYARARLAARSTVQELAEVAGMSRYQLDRRMQRVFGLTTGQWLVQQRIEAAQRLLRETDAPIAAIALDVGYSDQSAFTRQFHRTTGMSPRDYRGPRLSVVGGMKG